MLPYPESFQPDDRKLVFHFLATFARWECALKHNGFVRAGRHGQAEPDWRAFAAAYEQVLSSREDPDLAAASDVLLQNPPKREELSGDKIVWGHNPRRDSETGDADYLLRVVKDVRNNLFHGGKFSGGPEPELAHDRRLLNSAIAILEGAANLHPGIQSMLNESI